MLLDRIKITLVLEASGDLHLGTGHASPREGGEGEIAWCVRHVNGRPHIPGTSLKGALRAALERNGEHALASARMGDPSLHEAGKGRMGTIWIEGATAIDGTSPSVVGLDAGPASCAEGAFVKAQTRIDRSRGAAEEHLLYFSERIPSGTRFNVTITGYSADVANDGRQLAGDLGHIVAKIDTVEGLPIGRGSGRGMTTLKRESCEFSVRRLGSDATLEDDPALADELRSTFDDAVESAAPGLTTWKALRLRCDGPFISRGPIEKDADATGQHRQVTAPLRRDDKPVLWPSSVLGALRARAAWLAELARLRQGTSCPFSPPDRPADCPMDDRSLEQALDGRRAVRDLDDVARLSSVERLFGVPGWRGRWAIGRIVCTNDTLCWPDLQQVSIDRFSGGARQGLLFKTRTALDPVFEVDYRIDEHEALTQPDHDLAELMIKSLTDGGTLYLGHGASKGFGWFTVEEIQ